MSVLMDEESSHGECLDCGCPRSDRRQDGLCGVCRDRKEAHLWEFEHYKDDFDFELGGES